MNPHRLVLCLLASAAAALMFAACAGAQRAAPSAPLPKPSLEFAFRIEVDLGPIEDIGTVDGMKRRIVPIVGGRVDGPLLKGSVAPGGADWQGVRPQDGLTRVFAHYWLKTEDGAVISVQNRGLRRADAATMARLIAGEIVDPSAYYFRASPEFEASGERYAFLNESLFVCVGARMPGKAIIEVYRVN